MKLKTIITILAFMLPIVFLASCKDIEDEEDNTLKPIITAKRILSGGALAKNIFWQVAGQVNLGINTHFEGIILSKTGITFQTGASLNGRALAQTAVVLDDNVVIQP